MDFEVLGPLRVRHGEQPARLSAPMHRTLLGMLLTRANTPVPAIEATASLYPPTSDWLAEISSNFQPRSSANRRMASLWVATGVVASAIRRPYSGLGPLGSRRSPSPEAHERPPGVE